MFFLFYRYFFLLVTDKRCDKYRIFRHFQVEQTIHIRHCSVRGAFFIHIDTRDRFVILVIHTTANSNLSLLLSCRTSGFRIRNDHLAIFYPELQPRFVCQTIQDSGYIFVIDLQRNLFIQNIQGILRIHENKLTVFLNIIDNILYCFILQLNSKSLLLGVHINPSRIYRDGTMSFPLVVAREFYSYS